MKLERLMQSSFSALADRGAQEAWKLLERTHLAPWSYAGGGRVPEEIERAERAIRSGGADERFFAGARQETKALLEKRCPQAIASTLEAAKHVCAGKFDLLGYKDLCFGSPIDWHFDPVANVHAPRLHWSQIRALDVAQVGDSKVIWELSRCQWMITLARAYALTGDEWLPLMIASHLRAWRAENPIGVGINWSSSLEVSLRLMSFCWIAFLLRDERALPAEDMQALLLSIREHARHVSRYLSRHFSPNTHLTGEALGLFYAGCALPELDEAAEFRNLGAQILLEQLEKQVLPDGVYFEQAACYQRYTIEIYLHFAVLARASGFGLPDAVNEQLVRMLDYLLALRRPDGSLAPIGDADGGWLVPLTERAPSDLRGIFSTAAALFRRADYAWAAGGLQPETLFLLGEAGADAFAKLKPAAPNRIASRLFPDGGTAVMSNGFGPRAHQLFFDCGPLGCPISGGHGHADLLAIQCSIFGEPVIVDPGTCIYTESWRGQFRSTRAHSTVTVDGQDQCVSTGPFSWAGERPIANLHRWITGPNLDFAEASHDAYKRLADPVRHRRRVLFVEQRCWIVVDDLEGAAEHEVALRFQLAPMKAIHSEKNGGWIRAETPQGHALLIKTFALAPLATTIHQGELEPKQGWVSPDYGQRIAAPMIVTSAHAKLPLRLATLLFPLENASDPAPEVSAVTNAAGPSGPQFAGGELVPF